MSVYKRYCRLCLFLLFTLNKSYAIAQTHIMRYGVLYTQRLLTFTFHTVQGQPYIKVKGTNLLSQNKNWFHELMNRIMN